MTTDQNITPFLWFDHQAEAAANFYTSVFQNARVEHVTRRGEAVMVADFTLGGQRFSALNGGPRFRFNPSVSIFVVCETETETDAVWSRLIDGGTALMPLDRYDWSDKYGWVQDRFGLTWQISLGTIADVGQKFTPCFLFTGAQSGQAEAAINAWTGIFDGSSVDVVLHYHAGEAGREGTVKYARFSLGGQKFIAMDNPMLDQTFTFNEALSFVVHCHTQAEVDYFWEKLTAGGEESMCGWLKDRFGVSWQVIPEALPRLLSDPDPATAQRAMNAMLQMRKIEIARLTEAPTGSSERITVQQTVQAPVEKIWKYWTEPAHIQQWNNASDDWHTPKATNDLRPGGRFVYTMAARDGSMSFDFEGVYDEVLEHRLIAYTIADGRKVTIHFEPGSAGVQITETFDAENMHSAEMQRAGWQAILDNFKRHVEGL